MSITNVPKIIIVTHDPRADMSSRLILAYLSRTMETVLIYRPEV